MSDYEILGVAYVTPEILREIADGMDAGNHVSLLEMGNGEQAVELEYDPEVLNPEAYRL